MENGVCNGRIDALLRKCFPDVKDFDQSVSYSLALQTNKKSFWSIIARVFFQWNDEKLSSKYPTSAFVKIPHISQNVKNLDKTGQEDNSADAEVLRKLTEFEVSWYERYGNDSIPYFPIPKFYAAEKVTVPETGIIIMEDLSERVKAMDFIPGFSFDQIERLMDALAGFHYHFISKKDQSWVDEFDRASEVDTDFQNLQYESALNSKKHLSQFLKRYHDTLTRLFNGNPPYTLDKVYEAYDRIFLYACNFALFGLSVYHDMCEDLEKDEVKRAKFRNELVDRAYGAVLDAGRLLSQQRN
ncbi:hypothetical protein COOONC_01407 [Cooperia oncophora]